MLCQSIGNGQSQAYISANYHSDSVSLKSPIPTPWCITYTQASTTCSITDVVDSKAANYPNIKMALHRHRPARYLLEICEGNCSWAYPLAWSWAEAMAVLLMPRETILSLADGPPRDVRKLHELVEKLFPSIERVAAMATGGAA